MLVNTSVWLVQLDRTNYGLINPWNNSIYPSYTLDYAKITLFPPVSNQISVPIRENSHPPLLGPFPNSNFVRQSVESGISLRIPVFMFNRGIAR